eukprot:TRINITY_DN8146_c0_g1_i1.p1 TRINITY_DN8146_c0_g1~~TRINITY_DN8146_c0_g1_i1.p1  ORF type:complete len:258 (-),score=50.87 TRINITY_DN8146_c0_g1_i1:125-871(-)
MSQEEIQEETVKIEPDESFVRFKIRVSEETDDILNKRIPEKLRSIEDLLLVFSRVLDSSAIKEKLEALSNATSIAINPENVNTSDLIVEEVKQLIELVCTIKIWSRFGMPKAEDAHTFECSVKSDIIYHLQALENSGAQVIKMLNNYCVKRATLASKILKHQNIEDLKMSIIMLDEVTRISLTRWQHTLRSLWIMIVDLFNKNWAVFEGNGDAATSVRKESASPRVRRQSSSSYSSSTAGTRSSFSRC